MRKVIGIGETILDLIFRNDQPTAAVPGGSTFNAMVSLARAGVEVDFISQIGNDHVGDLIENFMWKNGMNTRYMMRRKGVKTDVSLAFLNENNDAQYSFYKDYQNQQASMELPVVNKEDIILLGSFYSLNPLTRPAVGRLLQEAKEQGAIVYYDPNFRANHQQELIHLMPNMIENFEAASIIRGSNEDFGYIFGLTEPDRIYNEKMKFYGLPFICTTAHGDVSLRTSSISKEYPVPRLKTISTVGAGDNFNAGMLYGLIHEEIYRDHLPLLNANDWDKVVEYGIRFASEACLSYDNYISLEFARSLKENKPSASCR